MRRENNRNDENYFEKCENSFRYNSLHIISIKNKAEKKSLKKIKIIIFSKIIKFSQEIFIEDSILC